MSDTPDTRNDKRESAPSIWNRVWTLPVYPLIVACLPLLNTYGSNTNLFSDATLLLRPVVFSVLIAGLLTAVASFVLRNRHRAAVFAAGILILLSYGEFAAEPMARYASLATGWPIGPEFPLLAFLVAFAAIIALSRVPPVLTVGANVWGVAMLVIYPAVWASVPLINVVVGHQKEKPAATNVFANAQDARGKPDIYHITLDGYARGDVLRELYGFDNSVFLNSLREMGFSIAEEATTPYNQTQLVMLSIFEGSYLDRLQTEANPSPDQYRNLLRERYLDNSAFRALTGTGYRIAASHTEYFPVDIGHHEVVAARPWFELTYFERTVFDQNALSLFARKFGLLDSTENYTASMIRDAYDPSVPGSLESPFLLYIHQIAPHPPFDVSRDGKPRKTLRLAHRLKDGVGFHEGNQRLRNEYRDGYVEKLRFINKETIEYLQQVIGDMPDPKIVIVHGDHGGGLYVDNKNLETTCVDERFLPLLAVYSSDGILQARLPKDINLVNIYRLVFNTYFETALPMLEGNSYFAPYQAPSVHIPVEVKPSATFCQAYK